MFLLWWFVPDNLTRFLGGILAYTLLAAIALGAWHSRKAWDTLSDPYDWIGAIIGSVLLGGLSFGIDFFVGSITHPDLPPFQAATKVGSPFGFLLTVFLCPGMTTVAVASLFRSLLIPKE
jgi:uncharacterized membrane protein YkvI